MHRDPYSRHNERRAEPSEAAKQARDKWLAANGGEEAIRRRIAVGGGPSEADLISMTDKWRAALHRPGAGRIRSQIANERLRTLRRALRLVRLGIVLCVLDILAALSLVVWFGILGHH